MYLNYVLYCEKGITLFTATEGPKETEVAVLDNMVDPNATETSTMTTRSRIIVCPKGRCFWPISHKLVMETMKICFIAFNLRLMILDPKIVYYLTDNVLHRHIIFIILHK